MIRNRYVSPSPLLCLSFFLFPILFLILFPISQTFQPFFFYPHRPRVSGKILWCNSQDSCDVINWKWEEGHAYVGLVDLDADVEHLAVGVGIGVVSADDFTVAGERCVRHAVVLVVGRSPRYCLHQGHHCAKHRQQTFNPVDLHIHAPINMLTSLAAAAAAIITIQHNNHATHSHTHTLTHKEAQTHRSRPYSVTFVCRHRWIN